MKYVVLLAHEPAVWSESSAADRAAYHQAHLDFHQAVGEHLVAGEALAGPDTATTLRHDGERAVLSDGPFAETAEMIGGFYLLDAASLDQVTGWCALLPRPYAVEIRPCVQIDGFD